MKNLIKYCLVLVLIFIGHISFSQTNDEYAGIEIGSRGIKFSVVKIVRLSEGQGVRLVDILGTREPENTNIVQNQFSSISIGASLDAVNGFFQDARNRGIPSDRIYIAISSGVRDAAIKLNFNLANFIEKIRTRVGFSNDREIGVVSPDDEARLLFIGSVKDDEWNKVLVVDIGSGNTKGGCVRSSDKTQFIPFHLNYGLSSIMTAIDPQGKKNIRNYNVGVDSLINTVIDSEIQYRVGNAFGNKEIVILTGGIMYAINGITRPETTIREGAYFSMTLDNVREFKRRVVEDYDNLIHPNINQIDGLTSEQKIAIENKLDRIRTDFNQRPLIAGATLLERIMTRLINESSIEKHFFYASNGYIAWIKGKVKESLYEQRLR